MPRFRIPITLSRYVLDNLPWASAVAHAMRDRLSVLINIFEMWGDDIPISKIRDNMRMFGANALYTEVMSEDFIRSLYLVTPQIVKFRCRVPSHRLFAETLGVSYSHTYTYPNLTIYLTPEFGTIFNEAQIAYIEAAYRWLSPIRDNVTVQFLEPFRFRPKLTMAARIRHFFFLSED